MKKPYYSEIIIAYFGHIMDRITAASVFITIVEQGSMSGAAHVLDMSRSMVTRYLTTMEDWAGARLLHRSTRRLSLTDAGKKVLHLCQQLQTTADDIPSFHHLSAETPTGLLRISCSQFVAQDILPNFVNDFFQRYPQVRLDLHISNHAVNLVEERIDLAIRISNQLDPNVIAKPLGTIHSTVCAATHYFEQYKLKPPQIISQLSQHNCLTYSYFGQSIWSFTQNEQPESVAVSGNLSANESTALLHATLKGVGISLQPSFAVKPYIESGELMTLLEDYQAQPLGIYGIYQSRKYMPFALRTFLDELAIYCSTLKL